MIKTQPIFKHDGCPLCKFWGRFYGHDVWYCSGKRVIITRYGNAPGDYASSSLKGRLDKEDLPPWITRN